MAPRNRLVTALGLFLLAHSLSASPNYNLPLERAYTLRNFEPFLLEKELARQIRSDGPVSFIFPRPCISGLDSNRVCGDPHGWTYLDSSQSRQLSVSPTLAYEYRYLSENISAFEGGFLASGQSGPVSFLVDARTFTELHEDFKHDSYDRELVDRQDENVSGSLAYSSLSRYRSSLSFDLPWSRFAVGRDAVHWGPGLMTNLSLNQNAIPFNQITWLSHLGPISIMSLYGQLTIDGDSRGTIRINKDTRSLYAHRYEWRASKNLLVGLSEQLVVFNQEEPFAFVPIVPLFILKGTAVERSNNGNISADLAYRLGGLASVYSEFYVDDLQSPTSLFDDFWGNKWAWMFGTHFSLPTRHGLAGLVLEYSRVEPWVYTHYKPGTAQTANGGFAIGNPLGPNSQWMIAKAYFRGPAGLYASARSELIWKGTDLGSGIDDFIVDESEPKAFIRGIGSPEFSVSPHLGYSMKSVLLEASAKIGGNPGLNARIHWQY